MADNRITIGKGKPQIDKDKDLELLKKQDLYIPEKEIETGEQPPQTQTSDENLWGNDWQINSLIDKDYLAEKRLFVRVRYFRPFECRMFCTSPDAEPEKLDSILKLTMFDLSMGGIGAICDVSVPKDDILFFPLLLDHMTYDVKCQVVYCIPIDHVFRLGLRILTREKQFIKHLKLYVARLSLMGSKVTFKEIIDRYGPYYEKK